MVSWRIAQAVVSVKQGGVIAYPTEAVWGLGCDPHNQHAVHQLLQFKRRPESKGLILVASDIDQVRPFFADLTSVQSQLLASTWPGPVTWLVPHNGAIPRWITGKHSLLAVRVSDHPIVAALCSSFGGPLVSTSANRTGTVASKHRFQVHRYFGDNLDDYVPGQCGQQGRPTQIRNLLTGQTVRVG